MLQTLTLIPSEKNRYSKSVLWTYANIFTNSANERNKLTNSTRYVGKLHDTRCMLICWRYWREAASIDNMLNSWRYCEQPFVSYISSSCFKWRFYMAMSLIVSAYACIYVPLENNCSDSSSVENIDW